MAPPSAFGRQSSSQPDTAGASPPADPNDAAKAGRKSGRQSNWVMEQFTATEREGKTQWKCKHCSSLLSGTNITRLRDHLLNPRVCPFVHTSSAAESQVDMVQKAVDKLAGSAAAGQSKFTKQQTLPSTIQITTVSSSAQADLDSRFIRAVISANLPLSLTENEEVRWLFQGLNPSYKLPSRWDVSMALMQLSLHPNFSAKHSANPLRYYSYLHRTQLAGRLLYGLYSEVCEQVKQLISPTPPPEGTAARARFEPPNVVLILDGWSRSQVSSGY